MAQTATIVRKRPHRKVRSGCFRCKSKKVKCDERKPQCSHCERYSAECVYPPSAAVTDESKLISLPSPPKTNDSSPSASVSSPSMPGASPHISAACYPESRRSLATLTSAAGVPETSDLNLHDLELLHHWTTSAHAGFGDLPEDDRPWQIDIAQLALKHPFLMHGLLSVSALHLALLYPANRNHYLLRATHHQSLALPTYQHVMTDIKNNLTEENCHPLLAFAALTVAYAIAYPQSPDTSPSIVPEWFLMLRGPRDLVSQEADYWSVCAVAGPWLMKGPMAFQLRQVQEHVDFGLNPDDQNLAALEQLFERRNGIITPSEFDDLDIYRTTLSLLREHAAYPYMQNALLGPKMAAFQFVEKLPERFLHLLQRRQPEALILLAHFCVLMKQAEDDWYMSGAAERTLSMVKSNLDESWRNWITWPSTRIWASR